MKSILIRRIAAFFSIILLGVSPTYAQSWAWFQGDWEGGVYQGNINASYHAELLINDGAVGTIVGTSHYPELNCGGYLTLQSMSANRATFLETVTYGMSSCVNAIVTLDYVSTGTVLYGAFYLNGQQVVFSEPLSRTSPIICGNPELHDTFSPVHPSYHTYAFQTTICNVTEVGAGGVVCNGRNIFRLMTMQLQYAAPALSWNSTVRVKDCGVYDLEFVLSANRITTRVDIGNRMVTNLTMPGHLFHPGKIVRRVVELSNGDVVMRTSGDGEGDYGSFNVEFGQPLFQSIDDALRDRFLNGP